MALDTLEEMGLEATPKRVEALFRLIKDALEAVAQKDAMRKQKEKRT